MTATRQNNNVGAIVALIFLCTASMEAIAKPFAEPGDLTLRNDLELLKDANAINLPLGSWPVSWGDIAFALANVNADALGKYEALAYERLRQRASNATATGVVDLEISIGAASNPQVIRAFEDKNRTNGEIGGTVHWTGDRFAYNLSATAVSNPADGENLRPDDSYVGVVLGNWMISVGWQQRWWGPGHDGSLILSTNARPVPAVALQRNFSRAFENRWLHWLGPWTLTAFMGQLEDEREIESAQLFGVRATFVPLRGLEIGLSRTAQWCGESRPCDAGTFLDLLLGNDNQGVNVDPSAEPGNQLAGIDVRWRLPAKMPIAVYAQWIGEDTRNGGPEIGSWLRQAGIEYWSGVGTVQHRTFVELSETSCRDGGLGFSDVQPNCGYEHSIYRTGYRYLGMPLGHGMDGDGLSYSIGSTLIQSNGPTWSAAVRRIKINRVGQENPIHTLSATPQTLSEITASYERPTSVGIFHAGIGYSRLKDELRGEKMSDVSLFVNLSSW